MGPTYHVILAYLELEQLPGSHALKVLDIRIDDTAMLRYLNGPR